MAVLIGGRAHAWSLIIAGTIGLIAGFLTFLYPGVTAFTLLIVIAAWALARGIFEIVMAIRLRMQLHGEWLLIVAGALSVLFGLMLLLNPGAGALAMVWLVGFYALMFGITMCAIALRLRRLSHHHL
jgi:uncharacterized membrane protein HdeD (DUF308 family)